ncbi:MAG: HD domain-containing protein [Vicinamibacterales bacterium]|nr:HD domain-containing protein [Vicinamibacterales bacterium]
MTIPARWQQRAHRWLVGTVFVFGVAALADAVHTLGARLIDPWWILFGVLTLVTGAFAVKVPALNATLSISETFLFALAIMFGPAPAVATVALDGLTLSLLRRRRNPRQVAFNVAEPAVSMWVAAQVYYVTSGVRPLMDAPATLAEVALPALALAGTYFLMNSVLNALAMATEAGTSPLALWRKYFLWVSLNYFGGVSIAVLLAVNSQDFTLGGLLAIAPLVFISYFTFKSSMGRLEDENTHLAEVNRLYLKVVETLAMAVDAKDQVTHGHIRRVQTFALRLAKALGVTNPSDVKAIEAAALLHDMGKLAVPEHILNKPGKLTDTEYERMKLHAPLGADMLSAVEFPYPVVPIVRHHHENFDGTGYPDRLAGEAIPIGARILSVVDCYDALRSHRPYRRALTPDQAFAIVAERRGTMYDPAVVDAFESIRAAIEAETVEEALPEVLDRFAKAAREMRHRDLSADMLPLERRLEASAALVQLHEQLSRLTREASLEEHCGVIDRYVRRLVPAGLVAVFMRDERTESLRVVYTSGYGDTCLTGLSIPMGHGVSGWVAANRQSVTNADPTLDVDSRFDALAPSFRSVMSVPLVFDRTSIGALSFFSAQERAFTDDHRRSLEVLSGAIADTLVRALPRGSEQAFIPMPVPSPSHSLDALLRRDSLWTATGARTAGVLYLRTPGDSEAMAQAALAANQATRVADLIFRVAPDELVVLMPDCDASAGHVVTGRLAEALVTLEATAPVIDALRVGFACSPHDGASLGDLLRASRERAEGAPTAQQAPCPALAPALAHAFSRGGAS